ncbi:MAG: hypothetical protein ACYC7D_03150 [Nitrososphaerales archaeon]
MTTEFQTTSGASYQNDINTVIVKSSITQQVSISIPENLAIRIKERLPNSDFSTVDQYAAAVLESVLRELDKAAVSQTGHSNDSYNEIDERASKQNEVFSEEDQNEIEGRLRGLGYM